MKNTKKRILVTGATGYIGSRIVRWLLRKDTLLVATGLEKNPDPKKHSWIKQVKYIPFKFKNTKDNLYTFFQRPQAVIHLAWEGLPNYNKLFHIEKNLPENYNFLRNLIFNGCKKVSVIGTCFEYGLIDGCLNETMITNPCTAYGLAKDSLRKFLEQLTKEHAFTLQWIRLFYNFGKGQKRKSIFVQLEDAINQKDNIFNMSKGEQLRDYMHINDIIDCVGKIVLQDKINGIINCSSGKPVSIRNIIDKYIAFRKSKIKLNLGYYPYAEYEPMAFWGDNSKMQNICKMNNFDINFS